METDISSWVALIRQYEHPTELTADMLNALIEKIIIHEKTVGEGDEKEQEMDGRSGLLEKSAVIISGGSI